MTIEEEFEAERVERHRELTKVCEALVEACKTAHRFDIQFAVNKMWDVYGEVVGNIALTKLRRED